ncbi:UPF0488 protein C8orf33 homolog isoform X3 [Caretta caretta]|uniref:UPF0488 protein C8orf33 homolog isoform X3 n=1 Tax=Caretta caretta TaxID=8467 RepID=UPI002095A0F2|nr:UPF0488 protein C8orf33 homolog isoform X2 [Caretta caretta]
MEEAPQGTFQDELEWCILQLETGLLHLNPTPKQAEETRHVLKILRSRKAAFVKKRQVMNHVFGDYRLKMAEEQKRTEKAAMKPGKVQIQQGKAPASGSMVYRKRSGQTSETATNWFTPSDNSFQFSFALPEMDPQATNGTLEEAQGVGGSEQRPISVSSLKSSSSGEVLNFSTTGQEPKFAFNFVIPDKDGPMMPSVVTGQRAESVAENVTSHGLASAGPMKHSTLLEANMPEVVGCVGGGLGREALFFETPKPEIASVDEVKAGKTAAAGAPKKKKKKKKPSNSKKEMAEAEVSKKVKVGASGCEDTDLSVQDKTMQRIRHSTGNMEPAQITAAIMSTINTACIIQQDMQNHNMQEKRNQARRRRLQRGDESDEDMDIDFSQSTGPCNVHIMVTIGQVHGMERQFWARETSTDR